MPKNEPPKPAIPFVGRAKELGRLRQWHRQRKLVLILGAPGVGKTTLVAQAGRSLSLLVCPQSERLSDICASLEAQLGLAPANAHLISRKNRLLPALAERGQAVVFDAVGWTTPMLSSFFECVAGRVPVWIVSRSEHPWDTGHVWPLLSRFERLELHPFHPAETRELVERGVAAGQFPAAVLDTVEQLHQLAVGNPQVLCELLEGLASGRYDPHKRFDLKLLALDRRIGHLTATPFTGCGAASARSAKPARPAPRRA